MKRILYIAMAAMMILSSCSEKGLGEGFGTLKLSLVSEDGYVIRTKAGDEVNKDNFVITLKRTDLAQDDVQWIYAEFMQEPVKTLNEGTYTITVSSPASETGARYYGEKDFIVKTGKTSTVEVLCTISNIKVSVKCTENFLKELDSFTITAKNNHGELVWTEADYKTDGVIDPSIVKSGHLEVSDIQLTVIATRWSDADEENKIVNFFKEISGVEARDHHSITLDADITGAFGLQIIPDGSLVDKEVDYPIEDFEDVVQVGAAKLYVGVNEDNTEQLVLKSTSVSDRAYSLQIYNASDKLIREVAGYNPAEAQVLNLPYGTYRLVATSGEDVDYGIETPYYYGELSGISLTKENPEKTADITCTLANVKLTANFTEKIKEEFIEYKLTVGNGLGEVILSNLDGGIYELASGGTASKAAYFKVNDVLNWKLELKNTDNDSFEQSGSFSGVQAKQHYILNFDLEAKPELKSSEKYRIICTSKIN